MSEAAIIPAATAIVLALTRPAAAADALPIRLDYTAAPDCPDRAAFVERVRARVVHIDELPSLDWTVTAGGDSRGAVRGRLMIHDTNGEETTREVEGDSCAEVVSALALAAALTLDARTASPAPGSPYAVTPAPVTVGERIPRAPDDRRRRLHMAVGADTSLYAGIAPGTTPALGAFVELGLQRGAPSPRTGLVVGPLVRTAFVKSFDSTTLAGTGSATFSFTMGALDLCPARWEAGRFSVIACARGEAGVLEGEGREIVPARAQSRPWLATGGIGRMKFDLTEWLSLELSGGVRAPLSRTRYVFQPDTTVFRPPPVGGLASAGVSVRFP